MLDSKLFIECICAPGFSVGAAHFWRKNQSAASGFARFRSAAARVLSSDRGGLLLQAVDSGVSDPASWQVVSRRPLDPAWTAELQFAEYAAMTLRSNAISVSKGLTLLGREPGTSVGSMQRRWPCTNPQKKRAAHSLGQMHFSVSGLCRSGGSCRNRSDHPAGWVSARCRNHRSL